MREAFLLLSEVRKEGSEMYSKRYLFILVKAKSKAL
jgi:hypothetical protein